MSHTVTYKDEWPTEELAKRLRNVFHNNTLTAGIPISQTSEWLTVASEVASMLKAAKRDTLQEIWIMLGASPTWHAMGNKIIELIDALDAGENE